jgi:CubicO group peptidase (beta-lactamase class C family)
MQRFAMKLVWLAALLVASASIAAPPADLDRYAQRALQTFGTPGMTVAIVEQGKPYVVRSYGVRRMGEPAKVDEHTLFAIGSTTKAFTTALLAMLVDEGKLTWETKVADVLPGFKMYDPYVSSEMTIRDIVVHRSGLGPGAGDLMFFPPTNFTRAEIIHGLRYLKPVTSFRSSFAYDNLLYIVAGEVIATVEKSSWEDAVRKRILAPLQMNETTTTSVLPAGANRAWPHARASQEVRGTGPMSALSEVTTVDVAAAAGALNSNGLEIARWLELQLNAGADAKTGTRLFSEAQSRANAAAGSTGAAAARAGERAFPRLRARLGSGRLSRTGDRVARWWCARHGYAVRTRSGEARCVRVVYECGGVGGAVVDAVPAAGPLFGIEESGLDHGGERDVQGAACESAAATEGE